jgi:hypothetical protein
MEANASPQQSTGGSSGSSLATLDDDAIMTILLAAMQPPPLSWFMPVDVDGALPPAGRRHDRVLLRQERGPRIGNFLLARSGTGFSLLMLPPDEGGEPETLQVGVFRTVQDAASSLARFLRRVTFDHEAAATSS